MSCPLLSGQKVKTHTLALAHSWGTYSILHLEQPLAQTADLQHLEIPCSFSVRELDPGLPDLTVKPLRLQSVIQTHNMETRPTEAICYFLMNSPHRRLHMLNVKSEYACHDFPLCFRDTAVCSCWPLRFPHSYLTWQWLTDLTALSREPLRTVATVTIPFLQAASTMEARIGLAWITLHCQERKQDEGEVNWIYQVSFYR